MAVNVDNVYKTVLSILNKEQRGYMTPDEFNKVAKQVQLERYEATFREYNKSLNERKAYMSNNGAASDAQFSKERIDELSATTNITLSGGVGDLSSISYYMIEGVSSADRLKIFEEKTRLDINKSLPSPMTAPTADFPIFYRSILNGNEQINVYPDVAGVNNAELAIDYILYPQDPRWGYIEDDEYGSFVYDDNIYVADGLVVKEGAFTTFTSNISSGTDGVYNVNADISGQLLTLPLTVTVFGGVVTSVETTSSGSGFSVGDTLTVAGTEFSGTGNLVITIGTTNLFSGSVAGSTHFVLHQSEEVNLINGILAYSGVIVRDQLITQMAAQIAQSNAIQKQ